MAARNLLVTADATYADDAGDASVKIHQQLHDSVAGFVNLFDDAAPTDGKVYVYDGTVGRFMPVTLESKHVPLTTFEQQAGTAYTLALADAGKVKMTASADTSAVVWTIPTNASVPFPIGSAVGILQWGTGQITVTGSAGVTLRSVGGASKLSAQYARAVVEKVFTDTWLLTGGITV